MTAIRDNTVRRSHAAALGAAGFLSLAAAPTFAVMAVLTWVAGGSADMMCPATHGVSWLGGMVPMYVLMSAFHSAPWLRRSCGFLGTVFRLAGISEDLSLHDGSPSSIPGSSVSAS